MRRFPAAIGWLSWLPLTACVASQTAAPTAGRERPAVDRRLTRGDVQVARAYFQDFGFDPGPVAGLYTAQTQAAVRAYQSRYGLPVSGLLDEAPRRRLLPGLDFQHGR